MPASVGLWGGIACLLGRHVRSRGQAHATPEGWVSRCARCAIPMARAHGGGKWQVVKTSKRRIAGSKASAGERFSKAMIKSRAAGARKDAKEVLAAQKAAVDEAAAKRRHILGTAIDHEDVPAERNRRFFRRKKLAVIEARPKRARRFFLFRRKAAAEAVDDADSRVAAQAAPKLERPNGAGFAAENHEGEE